MAQNRIRGITIEIDGNTTKLQAALKEVNTQLSKTGTALKDVNSLLKLDPGNVDLLRQKQTLLTTAIDDTKKKLDQEKEALKQATANAPNYADWQRANEPIQKAIDETRERLKKLKDQAEETQEAMSQGKASTEQYDAIQAEIKETEISLKDLRAEQKRVSDEFGNPVSPEAFQGLQREVVSTEQDLKKLTDEFKEFGSVAAQQLSAVGGKMQEAGGKITDAGKALAPVSAVAAGIGMIYSQALRSFENIFSSKVLTTNDTKYLPFEIDGELDIVELPCALLELSLAKDNDDSADVVANILLAMDKMGGRRTRLLGEYKFIASSYLLTLYASVLGAPAIDTMLPPCIEDDIEELEKIGCKYMLNRQKSIDFFDVNSYFRINYILSEYRTDLLEQLCSLDTHKAQRTWRRAYADAGFWLKSAITIKDLRHAVRLAGCLSDNFLGYCYASGVLSSDAGTLRLVS